jgi:hypothetical protein
MYNPTGELPLSLTIRGVIGENFPLSHIKKSYSKRMVLPAQRKTVKNLDNQEF